MRLLGQTNHNTLHTRVHAGNSSVSETQWAAGGWEGGGGHRGRGREMVTAEVGTSSGERASAGRHG